MEHKKITTEIGRITLDIDSDFFGPSLSSCHAIDLVIDFLNGCKGKGATQVNLFHSTFTPEEVVFATYFVRDETELERIAREDKDNALDLRHKRAELVALERKVQELKEELENK